MRKIEQYKSVPGKLPLSYVYILSSSSMDSSIFWLTYKQEVCFELANFL